MVYPASVWDGDSANRDSDDNPAKAPDYRDWARMIEEIAATQTELDTTKTAVDALEAGITVEINSTGKSGAPNVLLGSESRKVLCNEDTLGETNYHTLPTAVAGLIFTFMCRHTDGIRVTAAAGDKIRLNGSLSIAAGYAESTVVGSTVELIAVDTTEWIARSINGTWVVETS